MNRSQHDWPQAIALSWIAASMACSVVWLSLLEEIFPVARKEKNIRLAAAYGHRLNEDGYQDD